MNAQIDAIIKNALAEDIGHGDLTALLCVPAEKESTAILRAKEDGVLAGTDAFSRVFALLDERVRVNFLKSDGDALETGKIFCELSGPARSLLTGERTALNFLQRLSGIATRTAEAVAKVAGTTARITDTRKTTPGLRVLEKRAVRTGGGANHRFGLFDGVLIKENHIAAAGGITAAISACRAGAPHTAKIEVETKNHAEVAEAVRAKADIIMLDNMSNEDMRQAVEFIAGRALTEASGNMADRDLREVAKTGVDIISIGALTHRIRSVDISMVFIDEE
ncbi:carboxylating nicotinate-nucleotide diphosphorylase [Oscillospiraceae bacterium OttesenSCG-928-G22]|nr:carboxylating nicotinate-nucleotide diphosphorylase [Oscillospiraceae bacterium OttesenSCG-928-G22]